MQYEVEQKHRFDGSESDLVIRLAGHGATLGEPKSQSDHYFAHPCRDFAQTDEALRIRTEDGKCFVTYKGPKIDQTTKTRRELELPLDESDIGGKEFAELLQAIGFSPVATIKKDRRPFAIQYAGHDVHGALDNVDKVGAFVELELMADETDLDDAKRVVSELAQKLELGPSIRRSYLELLLDQPRMRPTK
jgi:adenylate cyclase, class 2